MTEYLDFDTYLNMGGTLTEEEDFDRAYRRARAELDYRTFGRLRSEVDVSLNVKRCMVEMIDVCAAGYAMYGAPDGVHAVQSESNDGVSVHYATASAGDWFEKVYPGRVGAIIALYLADERNAAGECLLYRGCSR